jgi:hypothetical protein
MINMGFLQTVSVYELNNSLLFVAVTALLISLLNLYLTNDRRTSAVSFLSCLLTLLFSAAALYLIFVSDRIVLNNRYYFIAWLPYSIVFLNLTQLGFEYRNMKGSKGFDIDFVSRYHFNVSLQTGLITSLLSLVVFAFLPRELAFIIAVSSLLIILSLTVTHFLVRRFLREK